MIVYAITIQEFPKGVACDGQTVVGPGTDMERLFAGCLDVAMRTASENLAKWAGNGEIIEGKNIEAVVADRVKRFLAEK